MADITDNLEATTEAADAASGDQHRMAITRGPRKVIKTVGLTDAEKAVLARIKEPENRKRVAEQIKKTKARFPVSEGWAGLEASGVETNRAGEVKFNPKTGAPKPIYKGVGFNYDRDKSGAKLSRGTPEHEKAVRALTNRALTEVRKVVERANNGDKNAQTILRQVGWYRETMKKGFDERGGAYPAFADLLGATSPNTNVEENYRLAHDAQQGHARGDFDAQNEHMLGYEGNMNEYPEDQLIRQRNGAQFGMNSRNASMAMTDRWRQEAPKQAPKARNFSGNLSGRSDKATIDVWAARFLNRMARKARVPIPAQVGVEGEMRPDRQDRKMIGPVGLKASGEFGFGQDVFERLANRLNQTGELAPFLKELDYKHLTPADLQALTWFIEKEHWGQKGWTSKGGGEGGSFEDEIAKYPSHRYQAGFSIQQDKPPEDDEMHAAAQHIHEGLANDDKVRVFRVNPTYGRYGGENERSFDSEVTAHPDWDPTDWMVRHLELAKQHNQKDVFFSRRLDPQEAAEHDNARPGVEIYFKNRKAMQAAQPMLDEFTKNGIDGFTYITDLRHAQRTAKGKDSKDYVGVRLQWVPEISQRWDDSLAERWKDPEALKADRDDAVERMQDVVHHLDKQRHGIVDARVHWYDTVVSGKEDYDDHIAELKAAGQASGDAGGATRTVAPKVRGGLGLHANIARRDRALRAPAGARDAGPSPALDGGPDLTFKKGGSVPPYEPGSPIHHPVGDDPIIIGAIESDVPGRTDKHECSVPAGSYVIPADVVSALGQGNTLAGQRVLDKRFRQGDLGPPDIHQHMARGGPATTVPVVLAGGEYVVAPAAVSRAGMGDLKRGHAALDKFVRATRAKTVKTLRKLPGPKR